MVSKANSDKQDEGSVFRAEDIVPPNDKETHPITGAAHDANEIPKFDLAEQIMAEQRKITAVKRKAPGKPQPPFLLPQKARGQDGAAGKKVKVPVLPPNVQSVGYNIKHPPPALLRHEQIISEIVARDIEKLCRGDISSVHNC